MSPGAAPRIIPTGHAVQVGKLILYGEVEICWPEMVTTSTLTIVWTSRESLKPTHCGRLVPIRQGSQNPFGSGLHVVGSLPTQPWLSGGPSAISYDRLQG